MKSMTAEAAAMRDHPEEAQDLQLSLGAWACSSAQHIRKRFLEEQLSLLLVDRVYLTKSPLEGAAR